MKRLLIIGLFFVLIFLVLFGISVKNDVAGVKGGKPVIVTISYGESGANVANILAENKVIKYPLAFRIYTNLTGSAAKFQAGSHAFVKGMGYGEIIKTLSLTSNGGMVKVTIPEGFELRMIADRLEENSLIDKDKFYKELETGVFKSSFKLPQRENRFEGYLFPDTYLFKPDESEHNIIQAMLSRFDEIMSKYNDRTKEIGMSYDQTVILASIIEREAGSTADMPIVSSVFHNRLISNEYPYLQSCATVQYVLKERKDVLSEADTKIKSPYNTYINKGLPVGPIASPGEAAIKAALYPDKTDYYFFVVVKGKTVFSKTFSEHLAVQQ